MVIDSQRQMHKTGWLARGFEQDLLLRYLSGDESLSGVSLDQPRGICKFTTKVGRCKDNVIHVIFLACLAWWGYISTTLSFPFRETDIYMCTFGKPTYVSSCLTSNL